MSFCFKCDDLLSSVYIAFNIMCVILKVNCIGVGFRSETKARFQHENLGTRLVHSWTCGVVLHVCDIPVPIAGVHAAE